jgi:transcriptional regulator with XRE-family HTH domain
MATMLAPVDAREVLRCDVCTLVQFRTSSNHCRRCRQPLDIDLGPSVLDTPVAPAPKAASGDDRNSNTLQVAAAIRSLRQRAGLSQRQLAQRMGVPRTYVSKIENDKALPTLGSLERLAEALGVTVPELLRCSERRSQHAEDLMSDPFLALLMPDLLKLDTMQRGLLLGELRVMALKARPAA